MKRLQEIKAYIDIVRHGPFDISTEDGRGKERLRRIALTALTALLAKLIAVVTPLITLRITIPYLGEEIYGLWITVVSFFAMMTYADLGLGSGLQTELSRASASGDSIRCKKMVSSTYVVLTSIAFALITIFLLAYPYINWARLFNAQTADSINLAGPIVIVILIPKLLNIPLAIIQRTQNAMQEAYNTNLWQIVGNILSLILVVIISLLDGDKVFMILASTGIVVIVALLNMIYYFAKQRPELRPSARCFDGKIAKSILKTGVLFCALSVFTTISLSIDNWIVARTSELSTVTSYSVMLRLANLINTVSLMISAPLWSANGEALARGDVSWVKNNTDKMAKLSVGLAVCISLFLLLFSRPVLGFLTKDIVAPDYFMLLGMCVLNIVISYTNPYFMVLNGSKVVIFQIITYAIFSAVSLPLKFIIGNWMGIEFIPWITVVAYLTLLTVPTYKKAGNVLQTRNT